MYLSLYIYVTIAFSAVLIFVLFYTRKPVKETDRVSPEELEEKAWRVTEQIQKVTDTGVKALTEKLNEMTSILEKMENVKQRLDLAEELGEKIVSGITNTSEEYLQMLQRETQIIEDKINHHKKMEIQGPVVPKVQIKNDEKKQYIYQLFDEGKSIKEIADASGMHPGFVDVVINLRRLEKRA